MSISLILRLQWLLSCKQGVHVSYTLTVIKLVIVYLRWGIVKALSGHYIVIHNLACAHVLQLGCERVLVCITAITLWYQLIIIEDLHIFFACRRTDKSTGHSFFV